jgi:hypothetical protein
MVVSCNGILPLGSSSAGSRLRLRRFRPSFASPRTEICAALLTASFQPPPGNEKESGGKKWETKARRDAALQYDITSTIAREEPGD